MHPPMSPQLLLLFLLLPISTLSQRQQTPTNSNPPERVQIINSNSVLLALLDSSHYTDLSDLLDKALLLPTLEHSLSTPHNLTILAPNNAALERDLHPEFKHFLLQPKNLKPLQSLLLHHFLPTTIHFSNSTEPTRQYSTLAADSVEIGGVNSELRVVRPNDVVRADGVIHGIERLLVPRSVQEEFNKRRSLESISAVKPEPAPVVDPRRTHRLKKPSPPVPAGSPPALPVYDAMAPGPSLAPAPAPGPGGPHHHFDGEAQVKDFIQTLLSYGGYNEMADIMVNLTNLASEMGRLVSEGYVLTVLAPNDEAMGRLTAERLAEPGAPEQIMYYHMIPEYQTEESMYNAVRRFGSVRYETLRLGRKVVATEADGSVRFGEGEASAYLFDPDIFTDGRISVQGIDDVLFPAEEAAERKAEARSVTTRVKVAPKPRRGKLLQVACRLLGAIGQDSRFTTCH